MELVWDGEGDFHSGKHCRFCKIKANCRKRAEEMPKHDFKEPPTLTIPEIEDILDRADEVTSYLNDVKAFALAEILDDKPYDKYTVKEGHS